MKKVYCAQCYYYYFCQNNSIHYCDHPKWSKKVTKQGTAIHPPTKVTRWHGNHRAPTVTNKNNDCQLFKKRKWWHFK